MGLTHGVMVTQLVLVQPFKVRILVGQQKTFGDIRRFFYFYPMTNRYTFFLIVALFVSCQWSIKGKIEKWEWEQHHCVIQAFTDISKTNPVYARDSLMILNRTLDSLHAIKIKHLSLLIDSAYYCYVQAKHEYDNIANPRLKKAYHLGLNNLEYKYHMLLKADSVYRKHPEQTQFQDLLKRIESYTKNPDKYLGRLYAVKFIGYEGSLDSRHYNKIYFMNAKNRIVEIR